MPKTVAYHGSLFLFIALLVGGCGSSSERSPSGPAAYPLTVASYNMHHAVGADGVLDLERIAGVIRKTGAEVVALQEVDRHWSARSRFADQARELARMLDMHVVYGANLDRGPPAPGRPRRQYGTAVLSRYPILTSRNIPLPNIGGEQRGLLEVVIAFHGRRIRVYGTHLQHDDPAERQLQTQAILDTIGTPKEPVVLMGDFNATPDAREMRGLLDAFVDAWSVAGQGNGYTIPVTDPSRRIDYVLVSDDVEVRSVRVLQTTASDHLPVAAGLRVRVPGSPVPLSRAHAHNDYLHERPLLDALARGFGSVEVDVYLVEGHLLVAHDRSEVQPGRTLEALYLAPLRERLRRHGGWIYPEHRLSLLLLVDIKSEAEATYKALREVLHRYRDHLTTFTPDTVEKGPITVIVSGNRPRARMETLSVRYAAYDGRLEDLSAEEPAPPAFMPLVSSNWSNITTWQGEGEMPEAARQRLQRAVEEAHAQGKLIRFWATADTPAVWRALLTAGVDLINADDLGKLQTFLLQQGPSTEARRGFLGITRATQKAVTH